MVTSPAPTGARRRICVFTGTRAEYGLLRPLMRRLRDDPSVTLQILVSGAHLSPSHGATWQEIASDGFTIDARAEILLDADTNTAVCSAMGLGLMRFGEAIDRLAPDCLVLLGDRYEALAAAAAATVCRVPIAHLHGGELTEGAIDNAFRHAITKMSHLHFTSTEIYRQRVIQMGEAAASVFNVGALGCENAREVTPIPRGEVLRRLGLDTNARYVLVTFHPATLDTEPPLAQLEALLTALNRFPELAVVFTGANADMGGRALNDRLAAEAAAAPERIRLHASLGATLYLSAAREAVAVAGNSSSGIIEVPSLGVPIIDIGSRQAGRERANSVIWSLPNATAIHAALTKALSNEHLQIARTTANPYDGGSTSTHIHDILARSDLTGALRKSFITSTSFPAQWQHSSAGSASPAGPRTT